MDRQFKAYFFVSLVRIADKYEINMGKSLSHLLNPLMNPNQRTMHNPPFKKKNESRPGTIFLLQTAANHKNIHKLNFCLFNVVENNEECLFSAKLGVLGGILNHLASNCWIYKNPSIYEPPPSANPPNQILQTRGVKKWGLGAVSPETGQYDPIEHSSVGWCTLCGGARTEASAPLDAGRFLLPARCSDCIRPASSSAGRFIIPS